MNYVKELIDDKHLTKTITSSYINADNRKFNAMKQAQEAKHDLEEIQAQLIMTIFKPPLSSMHVLQLIKNGIITVNLRKALLK